MSSDAQGGWVLRVLGVDVRAGASGGSGIAAAARQWQAASETVDAQISRLQSVLRDSGDDELKQIAEFGLNAITVNRKVPLMAALMSAQAGDRRAVEDLQKAVIAFRIQIESDARVAVCDDNPFGVQVSIRGVLIPALEHLLKATQ